MKLSKLYCNKGGFKNIKFNLSGLSVIYADVQSQIDEKKNSHDLGKTKLGELIDFLFLKGVGGKYFLYKVKDDKDQSPFKEYIFFMELRLNSNQYLTIKRSVENNTKISFSLNDQSSGDFVPPLKWDEENVPFSKAKKILNTYLELDFFSNKDYDYRKAINYSLRLQGDYEDVYKLSKYVGGFDIDWKPFMFDLLGFNGGLLSTKYENDKMIEDIDSFIVKIKNEYSINPKDRDDLIAQIKLIENHYKEVEQQVDGFNFYEKDKELISKGIDTIETSISDLNAQAYNLNYEIDRLRKSIKNKFAFNLDKVKKVFDESKLYFPKELQNDYKALIDFNDQLTVERNNLLKSTLIRKSEELEIINKELKELNYRQEQLLLFLKDTDSFKKFKSYQKELVKIEGELSKIREKIKHIDVILEKEKEITILSKRIESTVDNLKDIFQHTENNNKYSEIRTKFSSYYKKIMDEDARLSWNINSNNNVDFIPPKVQTKGDVKRDTAKDEGKTYKKLLCVAFDLAILSVYNQESYFRFVYHDDVLSQQDNGIKKRLLELIRDLTNTFDLQYILSAIKSDLPIDENDLPIHFSDEEIVLRLHDRDVTGTLFGFEF